jgi:hypothetical protein
MQVNPRAKPTTTKIIPVDFLKPYLHFTEHLIYVTQNPTRMHDKELEKLKP